MAKKGYEHARWGLKVSTPGGDDVRSLNTSELFAMGSNTKLYSVGTYLDVFGPDHTTTTPVYAVGDDLVLVGSGDLVLGGSNADDPDAAELGYGLPPQNDANALPGAQLSPGDPLAGLDSLAAQVAAAGITEVRGDVVVDDRLFETWDTDGGPVSPITVNDNLIAVLTTPAGAGEPATVEVVPETAAFTVDAQVETTDAGADADLSLGPAETTDDGQMVGNALVIRGAIPEGADPVLRVFEVDDPASYARALFIEALRRAGVDVTAPVVAENDPSGLPGAYESEPVATFESATSRQVATLVWKVSHNYGANLLTCLLAVDAGSTDCEDGLTVVHERAGELGIGPDELWMINGAGSRFSSTTPDAMVTWIEWMLSTEWGDDLGEMLPIMGVDGSLGLTQKDTPSTGKVQAKTGTWAGVDPGSRALLMPGQGLAGLMQDEAGTQYAFALYMNGATLEGDVNEQVMAASANLAAAAAAVQQSL